MPDLLPLLLIVVIVVVAVAIIAFLARRRREAQDAVIVAASTPVTELSEDDIAWRIGVSGADRPALLAAGLAAAEAEASDLAETETGRQLLPTPVEIPVAAAAVRPAEEVTSDVEQRPAEPLALSAIEPGVVGAARPRTPAPHPLPNRWRLGRDSSAVLLAAVLAILVVTIVSPGDRN